jgi:hypothetical protein
VIDLEDEDKQLLSTNNKWLSAKNPQSDAVAEMPGVTFANLLANAAKKSNDLKRKVSTKSI